VLTSVHREKPAQGMKLAFDYSRKPGSKPVLTCADLQRKMGGARQRDEPEWRNGRRDGLKNRCLRACGFKSHLRYQSLKQQIEWASARISALARMFFISRSIAEMRFIKLIFRL
jgi:hypothetical protein